MNQPVISVPPDALLGLWHRPLGEDVVLRAPQRSQSCRWESTEWRRVEFCYKHTLDICICKNESNRWALNDPALVCKSLPWRNAAEQPAAAAHRLEVRWRQIRHRLRRLPHLHRPPGEHVQYVGIRSFSCTMTVVTPTTTASEGCGNRWLPVMSQDSDARLCDNLMNCLMWDKPLLILPGARLKYKKN